jgi:DNA-directed RNA polymerase subunit RPC12/RpoP
MRKESPKTFISELARQIAEHSRWTERQLVNGSVVLRKRIRDLNDDDRTGVYSPYTGNWTTIDLSGIYSWNIVKPTIRANTAALASAKVKIDIKPRFIKDSTAEMAAQVALSVLEQKEREQWTQKLEEFIGNEVQLGAGMFVHAPVNPNKKRKHSLPQFEEVEVSGGGIAVCAGCGTEFEVTEAVETDAVVPCPECDGQAIIQALPETQKFDVPTGYQEFTTGDTDTRGFPFWEFRIDEMNTQGGDLSRAKWFEHHYPASVDELELEYPEAEEAIQGATSDLSYPLRWQYTLASGRTVPETESSDWPVRMKEVRDIWLTPAMYLNVELTEDIVLKSKEGVRFEAKQGGTFADGKFQGEAFEEPPVLCFRLVGENLIDIYPSDFREEFFYISFLSNASTFWALFATELITLQDIVNYVLTIQMYHIRRNAITSIVFNRGSFDPEAFDEDIIPTKENLPFDVPINQQFAIVPALTLSGEPMQMLQAVMAAKGDVTQVQPAMVGETQPGQPYAAQLLQKQQSLGLLAPAALSKATAKVNWSKWQVKTAQKNWTDEDTEELLKLNGEWTEDWIQAFLECNVETDLITDFVQGSEIPTTLIEREAKLRQTLMDIAQIAGVNPELANPRMINEILTEILQAGGIDIDVNNYESDERLAQSRYDKLLEIVQTSPIPPSQDPMQNQMFASQIVAQPVFQPFPFEGHATILEFYSDKARQEASKDDPNYLLLTCLTMLIQMEMQSQTLQGQMMVQQQLEVQAPAMQMQQAQAMQQQEQAGAEAEAGRQAESEGRDFEREKAQADRDERAADREYDAEKTQLEMLDRQEERASKERLAKKATK